MLDTRLQTISEMLNIWTCRHLSLNGKARMFKSLALTKIHYAASCLPITNNTINETDKVVYIFYHKWPTVKGNAITQAIEDGNIKDPK